MRHIYSIAGGKGGTGKSFVTASLGILLAQLGKKVLLVDLDLGAANLHTFLDVKNPETGLDEYLDKKVSSLDEVTTSTAISNLSFISSGRCSLEIANIHYAQKLKIIRAIHKLDYDYILLDLGSGTYFNTIDFFLASNQGFLITALEPVSIENMFRFLQSLYLRKIRHLIKEYGVSTIFQYHINRFKNLRVTSPYHLIEFFKKYDERIGKELENHFVNLRLYLILNQFRNGFDVNFGSKLAQVCNKHFYYSYDFAGNITFDTKVSEAILANEIFIQKYPYTKTAQDLKRIVKRVFYQVSKHSNSISKAS